MLRFINSLCLSKAPLALSPAPFSEAGDGVCGGGGGEGPGVRCTWDWPVLQSTGLKYNGFTTVTVLQLFCFGLQALSAEASEILPQYNRRTPKNYEEVRLAAQHCRDWSSSKFYGHGNKFLSTYHGLMRARRLHNSRRAANSS